MTLTGLVSIARQIIYFQKNRLARTLLMAPTPEWYSIAVTFRCNSRCATCGIWNSPAEDEVSLDVYSRFFEDKLVSKARNIEFTGGEPTLRKDIVEIISEAYEKCPKARVSLGTNCILDERVIEIAETFKTRPLHFSMSIDGFGTLHDNIRGVPNNFTKVLSVIHGLQELKSNGHPISFGASVCVSSLNVEKLSPLLQFLEKQRIPFQLTPYLKTRYGQFERSRISHAQLDFDNAKLKLAARRLFAKYDRPTYGRFVKFWAGEEYQKPPCYVLTKGSVSVRPNGDIPVCMFHDRKFILGNIASEDFANIWNGNHTQELRRTLHDCKECSYTHPNLCDALNNYYFHGWGYRDSILLGQRSKLLRFVVKRTLR